MRTFFVVAIATSMLLASCSTAAITPSATVTTLSPDAERLFRLSWESVPEHDGTHMRLRGYVENLYGEVAARVQLLAQALDTSGNIIDQKIEWLPGTVSSFGRAYYEIPNMRSANQYRVTVWAFDRGRGPSTGKIAPWADTHTARFPTTGNGRGDWI
jgi:hypothetical protein